TGKLKALMVPWKRESGDGCTACWPMLARTPVPDPTATAMRTCGDSRPLVVARVNTRAREAVYAVSLVAAAGLHPGLVNIRPGVVGNRPRGLKRSYRNPTSAVTRPVVIRSVAKAPSRRGSTW